MRSAPVLMTLLFATPFLADSSPNPATGRVWITKDANFVFGTDTPSSPTYGNLPGLNGYLEMQQLQKAGMSLAQIFRAATLNNARELKLDAQLGSIEPGKIANLVLMKKSPLESVDAYDSITTVWVHGQAFPREALSASSSI
jgi:imidazolonepropionase-like amidohydrolase